MGPALEIYLRERGCLDKECFIIDIENSKIVSFISLGAYLLMIKTLKWLKSCMDVRFHWDLLFQEELLKEKAIIAQQKRKVLEREYILVQEENKPILGFDQAKDEEDLIMDDETY